MDADVIVVGAGVAGLRCARELSVAGARVLVLEKSAGVGGRCATRRIDGQPVDHGVAFLHGSNPMFLRELESVDGTDVLWGWPERVSGSGSACQPDAFSENESRVAFANGVTAFPKSLARGLEIRFRTAVGLVAPDGEWVTLVPEGGGRSWRAAAAVLALPIEQTADFLEAAAKGSGDVAAARALLGMAGTVPCLTCIACYPPTVPEPDWQMNYPGDSGILQLISHDSSKRALPNERILVLQARPSWSRSHFDAPPETWANEMLAEAARITGPWAGRPSSIQTHRWRFARVERGNELAAPMKLRLRGGGVLGLAGEYFAPGGGVEAAWTSGRALARRLLVEE